MPWTIAHAAAVLPLRKFCPRRLSFAGLVIGSFVPDLGNYLQLSEMADEAHTLGPAFVVSLVLGLVLLLLARVVQRPLGELLPQPHREAVLALPPLCDPLSPKALAVALASLLIGALSHLLWDAFTHEEGYFVILLPLLQPALFTLAGHEIHVYNLLQHLSTLAGTLAIAICYLRYLHSLRVPAGVRKAEETRRYLFLGVAALLATVFAIPMAYGQANMAGWSWHSYPLIKCVVVYSTNNFAAFIVTTAMVLSLYSTLQKHATQAATRLR